MMPEHGTRGMGPIAEAGELPQPKLYGATSARSKTNIYIRRNDSESKFSISSFLLPKKKYSYIKSGIAWFRKQLIIAKFGYVLRTIHLGNLYNTNKLFNNKYLGY